MLKRTEDARATRVLGFGTYDKRLHPRVETLLDGFKKHGYVVRELNMPLGLSTASKVNLLRNAWRLPLFAVRLLTKWVRLTFQSWKYRRKNCPDIVLVGYMGHFDVLLARVLFRKAHIVLDHLIFAATTALDRGEAVGWKTRLLARLDGAALRAADTVVTDTEEHRKLVPECLRSRAVVVPVGTADSWFTARLPEIRSSSRLRVVFFGLFTPLQGTETIARALRLLHERGVEIDATLIGDGQDAAKARDILKAVPVKWLPWVEPRELAACVAQHDICLGVFGTTPKALAVIPNKVYQGAAAGCAIITSRTPPQERMLGQGAILVTPGDAVALADALQSCSEDRVYLKQLQEAAAGLADQQFRSARIIEPLLDRLGRVIAE